MMLAADDYSANPAKLTWTLKVDGTNPGLKLSNKKGPYTILYSDSLKSPKHKDGAFTATVTAKDAEGSSSSVKFTGKMGEAPVLKTTKLPKCPVSMGGTYSAKVALKSGTEPVTWKFHEEWSDPKGKTSFIRDYDIVSYDEYLPEGFTAKIEKDSKGSSYLLIEGTITSEFSPVNYEEDVEGDYVFAIPITIIASNDSGYDLRDYKIDLRLVKPKFVLPKGFQKTYTVAPNQYVNIDLVGIKLADFFGSTSGMLEIDDKPETSGLWIDYEDDDEGNVILTRL